MILMKLRLGLSLQVFLNIFFQNTQNEIFEIFKLFKNNMKFTRAAC